MYIVFDLSSVCTQLTNWWIALPWADIGDWASAAGAVIGMAVFGGLIAVRSVSGDSK